VKRAGAHFHVVGLQNDAALIRPIFLQRKNEILESAGRLGERWGHRVLAAIKGGEYSDATLKCLKVTVHPIRSKRRHLAHMNSDCHAQHRICTKKVR
jgi:hypothetical protein